jgi:hypothetical protein
VPEIKLNLDFIPEKIEIYQLVGVWENPKFLNKPTQILRVDTEGKVIGKEKKKCP